MAYVQEAQEDSEGSQGSENLGGDHQLEGDSDDGQEVPLDKWHVRRQPVAKILDSEKDNG